MSNMVLEHACQSAGMGATSGQQSTGHARGLRLILREARLKKGLSAREVCEQIAAELQRLGDTEATPPSSTALYYWEAFERHPSIANFAAWARVLGFRLVVELVEANSERAAVLVRTDEAAEVARRVDRLPEVRRKAIVEVIRAMTEDHGR